MFLLGVGLPMIVVAELTLVQRRTPGELQGRALSAADAMITTPLTIATAVGAVIIGTVGFRPIYLGVAVGFVVVGLALLPYRGVTKPVPEPASIPGDDVLLAEAEAVVPVQPDQV